MAGAPLIAFSAMSGIPGPLPLGMILGGAALQRCGNCSVLSLALATEAEYLSFERRADMYVSTLHHQSHGAEN